MTSGISSFLSTIPDSALAAMHENIIRQTAFAANVVQSQILTVGKLAFARDLALVDAEETFLEFLILVPVGDVHGTYAAVQSTWGYKIGIDTHIFLSFLFMEIFPHLVLMQPYRIGIAGMNSSPLMPSNVGSRLIRFCLPFMKIVWYSILRRFFSRFWPYFSRCEKLR
jgi:hypothetical protein